jgi:hypothetical protein
VVVNYKHVILFAIVCGLTDLAYLLSGGTVLNAGGPNSTALLHFDSLLLLHLVKSKTLLLVIGTTIAVAMTGDKSRPHVKWTALALGSATGLLLVADAFISPGLLISAHVYFVHTVLVILLVTIATNVLESGTTNGKVTSGVFVAVGGFFVILGVLAAAGTYAKSLQLNATQAEVASLLKSAGLGSSDLVIAKARPVDSTPCWLPLLSSASVLFCRDAELVLAPDQEKDIQQYRNAMYLYLTGYDTSSLEKALSPTGSIEEQKSIASVQDNFVLEGPHRDAALIETRNALIPMLSGVETHDPEAVHFFRQYKTILVIDSAERPIFLTSRLDSFLHLARSERVGDIVLSWYNPANGETK